MKDIVSNAVSGVMLLLFRPFRHNDRIKVADFEGSVCDIDLPTRTCEPTAKSSSSPTR